MTNSKAVGALIAALRKAKNLTQDEAAAEIGIARSTLASIERGHDSPGRRTMTAIADFFGISLDQLRDGTIAPPGPGASEVVKDPDELALLAFWRSLTDEQRVLVGRMLSVPQRRDRAA